MCTIDCDRVYCWPILYKTRERLHVLWPLFSFDLKEKTIGLFLYLIYFHTTFNYFHLFPLLFYTSTHNATNVGLLLYIIMWHRSSSSSYFHIFPFVFWHSSSTATVFSIPLLVTFVRTSSSCYLQLFPTIYISWSATHFTIHVWPAFGIRKYSDFVEFSVGWPLIILRVFSGGFKLYLLYPFVYVHYESGVVTHHRILPFYWYYSDRQRKAGFFGPFIWSSRDNFSMFILLPVIYFHRKFDDILFVSPVYVHSKEGSSLMTFMPLIYYFRRQDSLRTFLCPLGVKLVRPNYTLLLALPAYLRLKTGSYRLRIVGIFCTSRNSTDPEAVENFVALFPLFSYKKQAGMLVTVSVLWPFLTLHFSPRTSRYMRLSMLGPLIKHGGYEDDEGGVTVDERFLPFYWRYSSSAKEILVLFPIYLKFQTNKDESKFQICLLGFSSKTTPSSTSTYISPLLVLPPYYVKTTHGDGDMFQYLFPLCGRSVTASMKCWSVLWPLFRWYNDDVNHKSGFNILLFFRRVEGAGGTRKTTTYLTPLWYYHTTNTHTQHTALLLYNYVSSEEKRVLQVLWVLPEQASLFYYSAMGPNRTIYIFPLLHLRDQEGLNSISLFWIFHRTCAIVFYQTIHSHTDKFYIFPVVYVQPSTLFAIGWIVNPVVSVIYWNRVTGVFHMVPAACKTKEGWSIAWIGYYRVSLIGYWESGDTARAYVLPLFFFSQNVIDAWLYIALGLITVHTSDGEFDLRILYRLIRVSSGSVGRCEINPLIWWQRKPGKSSFLICGGLIGCYTGRRHTCRTCFCCVC